MYLYTYCIYWYISYSYAILHVVGRDSEIVIYDSPWLQFYTNQNGVGCVIMCVYVAGEFGDMQYQQCQLPSGSGTF